MSRSFLPHRTSVKNYKLLESAAHKRPIVSEFSGWQTILLGVLIKDIRVGSQSPNQHCERSVLLSYQFSYHFYKSNRCEKPNCLWMTNPKGKEDPLFNEEEYIKSKPKYLILILVATNEVFIKPNSHQMLDLYLFWIKHCMRRIWGNWDPVF